MKSRQKQQECEHYHKPSFFEWFEDDFQNCSCPGKDRFCIYGKRKFECPYFTPKTEKQ